MLILETLSCMPFNAFYLFLLIADTSDDDDDNDCAKAKRDVMVE